jgi:ribosomal protein S18 acetylase RimI-like enzyme
MLDMLSLKRLDLCDADAAARIHRLAGALIPGYDTSLHAAEEYVAFYHDRVLVDCEVWGAFDGVALRGHIALLPGWIEHLYVDPDIHRCGIGSSLLALGQRLQAELRLYTFQSNHRARGFYERHGFVIEELTDGARNEEKMPDMTYHWRR